MTVVFDGQAVSFAVRCTKNAIFRLAVRWLVSLLAVLATGAAASLDRQVFFGDLHIHTQLSMDAFLFGTRTTPDDAYRFAKGEPVRHASGLQLQLDRPLDFYAVTDHAEYLGLLAAIKTPGHPLHSAAEAQPLLDSSSIVERGAPVRGNLEFAQAHGNDKDLLAAWRRIVEAAEAHYEPGKLTTFVGFEYTSFRERGNLHRNVIFQGSQVPERPYGRLDSLNPEDLWRWQDDQRAAGMESMSIPHNSNGSDGWMFETLQSDGRVIDRAYSALRLRNEPLVEVTQVKGTSETHPFLSPNDEFADFEIFPYRIASWQKSKPQGSYVRDAYRRGLELASAGHGNPYKFGLVGASDSHNSGATYKEENYAGKVGLLDATPVRRAAIPSSPASELPSYRSVFRMLYGASGLTGVWAEENSREAIYAAFRRKETFATTGTRIKVRMFAGFGFPAKLHERSDMVERAAKRGVAMGGELTRARGPLMISAVAMRDAQGAPLQRLQVVKGWMQDGRSTEKVFDVACSDGGQIDSLSHRCADNKASVNLATCEPTGAGAEELSATWKDPEFDRKQAAFYYVRVLENPSCRWSTWDAMRAGVPARSGLNATLQERAYTSPIWFTPEGS